MACNIVKTASVTFKTDISNYMPRFINLLLQICSSKDMNVLLSAYSALSSGLLTLDKSVIMSLWEKYMTLTIEIFEDENDGSYFYSLISSLMDVVEEIGPTFLSNEFLEMFSSKIISGGLELQFQESVKHAQANYYKENEDFDEYDQMNEHFYPKDDTEDQSFVVGINVYTKTMFTLLGERFCPYFEQYIDKIMEFLDRTKNFDVFGKI